LKLFYTRMAANEVYTTGNHLRSNEQNKPISNWSKR